MAEPVNTVLIGVAPPKPGGPGPRTRIDALDMTKGVLVVTMVVYHSFNYSQDYTLGFKYLSFLPPSFILITGFLISRLYFKPEAAADPGVHGRLLLRGFRLLLLFTLLNVATQLAGRRKFTTDPQGIAYLADHWFEIYGIGGAQFAAFSILLPIAYLLLLAPLLILLDRWNGIVVPAMAISLAIFCATFSSTAESSVNLALLSVGLVGVILGRVPDGVLSALGRRWYAAAAGYGGYLAISQLRWHNPFDQLINACLALVAIFGLCAAMDSGSTLGRRLLIMGKYSLLAYILQIAILQALSRLFGRLEPFSVPFLLQMLGVLLVMILVAEGLEWARRKLSWIDASYRLVFA